MSPSVASAPDSSWLDTLLRVSLTSVILYRPLYDTAGHMADFAFVRLNPAAQRRFQLPEYPTQTYLAQYPHAVVEGVFGFYCETFAAGEARCFDVDYPHDDLHAYFRLSAQRHDDLLVVSCTDILHQEASPVEATLREARRQEQAARVVAEAQYAQLERVLDQAPALFCMLAGPTLVVDFVNAAYQHLMGGRPLRGRPLGKSMPELAGQGILEQLRAVYDTGELYHATEQPATLDFTNTGRLETRYFTFSYQARRDASGAVDGVIVLGYDVTEQVRHRQREDELNQRLVRANDELEARVHERTQALQRARAEAERQRAHLERLFFAAPAIVNTNLGPDHVFELVHPFTERLFGFRPLVGLPLRQALPDIQGPFLALMDEVYRTGRAYHGRGVPVRFGEAADGHPTEAYFDFTYQPLLGPAGQPEGVMTFAVDVTEQVMARQQAERNEARFRRLAETAPMIVWEADATGHTTYLSPHWQQITAAANGQGLGWRDYVHPQDQEPFSEAWEQAVRTGQPFQHELRLRLAATGEYCWFLDRAEPVCGPDGQVVQWVGAATNIDAQKQVQHTLQAREQYFRQMADLVPVFIWQTDAVGTCLYLNASWYSYTGQQPAEALGQGWQQAVHPEDVPRVAMLAQVAKAERQPFTVVYRLRHQDGQYRWVTDTGRPRFDAQGTLLGYLGCVTDIHEQKLAEQALQQLAVELQSTHVRAQDLNTELAARNQQLERLNVDLDNVVHMASHDLRQPALNIEGLVQALQEELPVPLTEPMSHILQLLFATLQRFDETLDGMLEVVRTQQDHGPAEPVALAEVLQAVQLDLEPLIRETRAHLEWELAGCDTIPLSATNARSVLYNLLSNALKYHHPDRAPSVRVQCERQAGYTVLTVEDNGLGLNALQQAELFRQFRRMHAHVEGIGIGLYLVKRIVENVGGRITVGSQPDVGTTFTVTFPT